MIIKCKQANHDTQYLISKVNVIETCDQLCRIFSCHLRPARQVLLEAILAVSLTTERRSFSKIIITTLTAKKKIQCVTLLKKKKKKNVPEVDKHLDRG